MRQSYCSLWSFLGSVLFIASYYGFLCDLGQPGGRPLGLEIRNHKCST